jgi:GT2 family glycosyltransferase
MARVVTPIDWGIVGRTFHVVLQAHPDEPALELRVARLSDFEAHGADVKGIHTLACMPSADPALRHCTVPPCPGDGQYVLLVAQVANPQASVSFSGVIVSAKHAWTPQHRRQPRRARPKLTAAYNPAAPRFSVITTVYDIEPRLLEETFSSVALQEFGDFEWLVLDNGSRMRETRQWVAALRGRNPRVQLFRVDRNLHIVGGNRYLLERARGDYIVPIDADDLLYPDALAWLAEAIQARPGLAMAYADEEKIDALGEPLEPIAREAWSRLTAAGTVPSSHPTTFRRDLALALGVYSDERTLGSHDWDTALRFADAGHKALHIPAILYGWRVHGGSTSLSATAKSYVGSSQQRVVQASLKRRGLEDLFSINETDAGPGYFHIARQRIKPAEVRLVVVLRGSDPGEVANALRTLRTTDYPLAEVVVVAMGSGLPRLARGLIDESRSTCSFPRPRFVEISGTDYSLARATGCDGATGHVAIIDGALRITSPAWIWDALGALDLDDEIGCVGGHISDAAGNVLHIGLVAGMDGGISTPHFGQPCASVRFKNLLVRHRAVTAVYNGFLLVRDSVVSRVGLPGLSDADCLACSLDWTARMMQAGFICAVAPGMSAMRDAALRHGAARFQRPPHPGRYPDDPQVDPYYGSYYCKESADYGLVAPLAEERHAGADLLARMMPAGWAAIAKSAFARRDSLGDAAANTKR